MGADSANGDSTGELDYLDAYARSMVSDGGHHNWSSPVASAVPASGRERLRVQRLNDKLFALRSVVPNITKTINSQMDKVSIVVDAIEYVQQLQEQERRLLADISILEQLLGTEQRGAPGSCAHQAVPRMKKMRGFLSSSSGATGASDMAATSPRIEALEVRVMEAGDKVLLVSIACRHRKDAIAKLCLALDGLCLDIISTSITSSSSGILRLTALVQSGEIHQHEMKEVIQTAIAQVDAV